MDTDERSDTDPDCKRHPAWLTKTTAQHNPEHTRLVEKGEKLLLEIDSYGSTFEATIYSQHLVSKKL